MMRQTPIGSHLAPFWLHKFRVLEREIEDKTFGINRCIWKKLALKRAGVGGSIPSLATIIPKNLFEFAENLSAHD